MKNTILNYIIDVDSRIINNSEGLKGWRKKSYQEAIEGVNKHRDELANLLTTLVN